METGDVRKRVLHTIEQARRRAAAHREDVSRANAAFAGLLESAGATWKQAANALRVAGFPFTVHTPAGYLRFASDRSPDDVLELSLDTNRRPVALVLRVTATRGRRVLEHETVVAEGDAIATVSEEALLEALLRELEPFVER